MDRKKIGAAIRALRESTGLSQDDFAWDYLKKKTLSQSRYEREGSPPQEVLLQLIKIALEKGKLDIANILKAAAVETVPEELRDLILEAAPGASSSSSGKQARR